MPNPEIKNIFSKTKVIALKINSNDSGYLNPLYENKKFKIVRFIKKI